MTILYLDTSSSFLYAGIIKDERLLGQVDKELNRDLSTYALSEIRALFNNCRCEPSDIDKIIVVNGPGSFTGVRIGLTIAKTFAWGLKKDITAISSLEAMAVSSDNYDYCVPLIDARRGYVYAGIYDKNYNQVLKNQYIKLETLLTAVDNLPSKVIMVSNNDFNNKISIVTYKPDILKIVNTFKTRPSINPHSIDADYLKLTEAEENKNG